MKGREARELILAGAAPEGLHVDGSLNLQGMRIKALPEGLRVGGSLWLRETQITALPEGLCVGRDLDLRGTPITALPEGLCVGGSLWLEGTPITALPEGLHVGRDLDLEGTPLAATYWTRERLVALLTGGGRRLADVANQTVWACHDWENCPMHAAYGANGFDGIPEAFRRDAQVFVPMFDAGLIPLALVIGGGGELDLRVEPEGGAQ